METIAPGSIQFANVDLREVLDIYALLANAQQEVDSRVRTSRALFSFTNTVALSRSEAVRLFEQVLEQQGGIAVKRADQQHIQVVPIEPRPGNAVR